jgi:hypothetical protein
MNPMLTKSRTAEGAIPASRIVTMGTTESQVTLATGAADALIGVSQSVVDAADTETVDIHFVGIVDVVAGGAITAGAWVTATTGGKAAATTTAGDELIGTALTSAAADGDIIEVVLSTSRY